MDLEVKQIKDLINEIYFNKNHDLDLQKKLLSLLSCYIGKNYYNLTILFRLILD